MPLLWREPLHPCLTRFQSVGTGGRHKASNKANLKRSLRSHKFAISLCFHTEGNNKIKLTALFFSQPTQQCPLPVYRPTYPPFVDSKWSQTLALG